MYVFNVAKSRDMREHKVAASWGNEKLKYNYKNTKKTPHPNKKNPTTNPG